MRRLTILLLTALLLTVVLLEAAAAVQAQTATPAPPSLTPPSPILATPSPTPTVTVTPVSTVTPTPAFGLATEQDMGLLPVGDARISTIDPPFISHVYTLTVEPREMLGFTLDVAQQPAYTNLLIEVKDAVGNLYKIFSNNGLFGLQVLDPFLLPAGGTYRVVVTNQTQPPASAAYTLGVRRYEPLPLALDSDVAGELTTDMPFGVYRFQAQAGQPLVAAMRTMNFNSRFVLYSPSLIEPLPVPGSFSTSADMSYQVFTPTQTGGYLLVVSSGYSGQVVPGRYSLSVRDMEVPPLRLNEETEFDVVFRADDPVRLFALDMTEPTLFNLTVTGEDGLDTAIALYDLSGALITSDDDGGPGYDPELLSPLLWQNGRLYLTVVMLEPVAEGRARLRLEPAVQAVLTLGQSAELRLRPKLRTALARFEAQAEGRYRLEVELLPASGVLPEVTILQGPTRLASASGQGVTTLSLEFVAPEAGPILIQVSDGTLIGQGARVMIVER